jgi:hypothetical protein
MNVNLPNAYVGSNIVFIQKQLVNIALLVRSLGRVGLPGK